MLKISNLSTKTEENLLQVTCLKLLLCLIISLAQLGMTLYLPAFPLMEKSINASRILLGCTLTVYILGYGVSILIWGAVAGRYGLKCCTSICVLLFSLSSFLLALITSIDFFISVRFIEGFAGGGCAVLARIVAKDCFKDKELAKVMAYLSSAFIISLGFGQLISGVVLKFFSWEAVFVVLGIFSLALFPLIIYFFPKSTEARSEANFKHLKLYIRILMRKSFMLGILTGGIGYSILASYNIITPFYFYEKFCLTPDAYARLSMYIVFSYLLGTIILNRLLKHLSFEKIVFVGFSGILLSGITLLALLILNQQTLALILLCICVALLFQSFIYPCVISITLRKNSDYSTHTMSLFGFMQQLIGVLVTSLVSIGSHLSLMPLVLVIIAVGVGGGAAMLFLKKATGQ